MTEFLFDLEDRVCNKANYKIKGSVAFPFQDGCSNFYTVQKDAGGEEVYAEHEIKKEVIDGGAHNPFPRFRN